MNKTRRKKQTRNKKRRNALKYIRVWTTVKQLTQAALEKLAEAGIRGALAGEELREKFQETTLTLEALMRKQLEQLGPPVEEEGEVFVESEGLFVPLGSIRDFKKPEFLKADAEVLVMRGPRLGTSYLKGTKQT